MAVENIHNLFVFIFMLTCFVYNYAGELSCPKNYVCVPMTKCDLENFSGLIYPCHKGLGFICCPPESTNHTVTQTENRRTSLFPVNCGVIEDENKISGGEKAEIGQFPWMALLGYKQTGIDFVEFLCGASVITTRYVLTAAHCLFNNERQLVVVRVGELDLAKEIDCKKHETEEICADKYVDHPVEKFKPHENYDKINYKNDIALVKVGNTIKFTNYVIPICLPYERGLEKNKFHKQRFTVSGWGKTSSGSLGGSSELLYTTVRTWDQSDCDLSMPPNVRPIENTQFCATGKTSEDACKGDSGGPIFNVTTDTDGSYRNFQTGIVSFAASIAACGNPDIPTVYTRVDKFLDWIADNIS